MTKESIYGESNSKCVCTKQQGCKIKKTMMRRIEMRNRRIRYYSMRLSLSQKLIEQLDRKIIKDIENIQLQSTSRI